MWLTCCATRRLPSTVARSSFYIEDAPVNRLLVEQMLLRCEGVSLIRAENGADGIAQVLQVQPDLVLLDMHLPDMKGFDVR